MRHHNSEGACRPSSPRHEEHDPGGRVGRQIGKSVIPCVPLDWARCGDVKQDVLWSIVRSHEPGRAVGVTPFSGEVTFDSLESWAVDALAHCLATLCAHAGGLSPVSPVRAARGRDGWSRDHRPIPARYTADNRPFHGPPPSPVALAIRPSRRSLRTSSLVPSCAAWPAASGTTTASCGPLGVGGRPPVPIPMPAPGATGGGVRGLTGLSVRTARAVAWPS